MDVLCVRKIQMEFQFDDVDNCPLNSNPDQADWNNNGVG